MFEDMDNWEFLSKFHKAKTNDVTLRNNSAKMSDIHLDACKGKPRRSALVSLANSSESPTMEQNAATISESSCCLKNFYFIRLFLKCLFYILLATI